MAVIANVLRSSHRLLLGRTFSSGSMRVTTPSIAGIALLARGFQAAAAADTIDDSIRGAYFGALVADALCLGSHYEYDAAKIKEAYDGEVIDEYMAPGERMGGETHGVGWGARNYHPGTVKGDQTDYGEYNVLVLEHLSRSVDDPHPFDVSEFIPVWQQRLSNGWKQWTCTQTKQTQQQIQQGVPTDELGGNSNAMALRYASIFAYYNNQEQLVDAARKTMFTHRERTAILANEFFARVTYQVIYRKVTPTKAIQDVALKSGRWIQSKVIQGLEKADEADNPDGQLFKEEFADDLALTSMARLWEVGKSEPIKVGKASPTEGTLPGAVYFIAKYQDSLIDAAKANAMVGGDNASRAIAIGMVLGAYHGAKGIPEKFKNGLNQWNHSEALLETFPLLRAGKAHGNHTEL
mmetsp:Transcript_15858/g.34551  ORF Transcript_15858/g.34551 Transcript_15858/m.34551 type:complete len:408 (-) Transcript_15858:126-1349(-)